MAVPKREANIRAMRNGPDGSAARTLRSFSVAAGATSSPRDVKVCTESTYPVRVSKVAKIVRTKARMPRRGAIQMNFFR